MEFGFSLNEVSSFQELILHFQFNPRNVEKGGTSIQLYIMQLVYNTKATSQAQDEEMKRLKKIEELDISRDKTMLLQRQPLKPKSRKANRKKVKTKLLYPQIKKEKAVSHCVIYIYIFANNIIDQV